MSERYNALNDDIHALCADIAAQYRIPEPCLDDPSIKRGLRNADGTGVIVGVSNIGSVQGYYVEDGVRVPIPGKLYYRGISMEDIVNAHHKSGTFGYEEVAYLLLFGKLPTREPQARFNRLLERSRRLPDRCNEDMILKAPSRNVMNQLERCVLDLYAYDEAADDVSLQNITRQSIELIGRFPLIAANAYRAKRHYYDNKSLHLHNPVPELSVAENYLRMLRADKSYTQEEAHLLDLMLILHAEHSSNNSTFVCRAISSSMTDTYSAIAGAVGSLKGPLHGGANAKVMEMLHYVRENTDPADDGSVTDYLNRLLDREAGDHSGKLYGLGHAVYTMSDPRAVMLKKYARSMAEKKGFTADFELLEKIETLGIRLLQERRRSDTPMCANVDLYSGLVYTMLGIPEELFTPLFASARISGWCANRIEEILTGKRIMRPAYRAVTIRGEYVPIEARTPQLLPEA